MMRDYYSILSPAIGSLDPNTPDARRAIYARARSAIINADLGTPEVQDELEALERVIDRIEGEAGRHRAPDAIRERRRVLDKPPINLKKTQRKVRPAFFRAASILLVCLGVFSIAVLGYLAWPKAGKSDRNAAPEHRPTSAVIAESHSTSNEIRPHTLNRQLVYYRSTYPAGTIVIAKSQRFLYLVRPEVVAVRYTLGVSGECSKAVGLLLVSGKEDSGLRQQKVAMNDTGAPLQGAAARQGNGSFGARSLALGDTGLRIHSTNAAANSGESCFRLVNEDMVDLYDRVLVGSRVIVN